MMPRKTLATTALAALLLSAAVGSAQVPGLTPEENRELREFREFWNSLPADRRGGVTMPEIDRIPPPRSGDQCYSAQHRAMMPCEMVWNTPRSSGVPMPSFENLMPGGNAEAPEPQLGVRSPAYRNLRAQISDQFRLYDDHYEDTREFLISFGFEPWVLETIGQTLCDEPGAYPACDLYPEFFVCEFDDRCTAYWANEEEDAYLIIEVSGGTGSRVPYSPSIGRRDIAEFSQTSTWDRGMGQREAEAEDLRRREEWRRQGIEAMRPYQ